MSIKDGRQERHTGRDDLKAVGGVIGEQDVIPPRQSRAATVERRLAWSWVGLAAAKRLLRDRRFEATVITSVLALAALPKGRPLKDLVLGIRRIIAWNDRRTTELERKSRRRGKA